MRILVDIILSFQEFRCIVGCGLFFDVGASDNKQQGRRSSSLPNTMLAEVLAVALRVDALGQQEGCRLSF
jgi:hypothetical protein